VESVRRYNEPPIVALACKSAKLSRFKLNMGNLVEAVGKINGFHFRLAPSV
jgi:hypothetical protein